MKSSAASSSSGAPAIPRPRWELPMDKELEFVDKYLDFYTKEDRERLLGKNALKIWRFPKQ